MNQPLASRTPRALSFHFGEATGGQKKNGSIPHQHFSKFFKFSCLGLLQIIYDPMN